jgi:hypothetical protein
MAPASVALPCWAMTGTLRPARPRVLSDGARINTAGTGADGGEHADAASGVGFEHATSTGLDDAHDDHGDFPCGNGFADVFEAVSCGGVAGDDDGLDRRLAELRRLALRWPESRLPSRKTASLMINSRR